MQFPPFPHKLLPLVLAATSFAAIAEEIKLQSVVVTAAGFEQAVEDAPASISVIEREELEKKAYRDVTDVLRDVPGVSISGGGSFSDIHIRGMDGDYTLILIDGRRQNARETRPNSDFGGIEQGFLPPLSAIERIEVVRGPMSSLYGSQALGGVINIITRKVPREWNASVRVEGTAQDASHSGNMYQQQVFLGGPLVDEVFGVQLYGQRSHRSEDSFQGGFNNQETTSGTAKFNLAVNTHHDFALELGHTQQKRISHAGRTSAATKKDKAGNIIPNTNSKSTYDKDTFALTHNGRFGETNTTTYLQRETSKNPGRKMTIENTEVSSQITALLAESHLTTFGFSGINEKLTDKGNQLKSKGVDSLERWQAALFAEDEWSVTDDFALTSGLRLTQDENFGKHFTPRLYGVWHSSEQWTLKGGISSGFKAPGLRQAVADWGQVTGGGKGDPAVILGNPNLKPEKSVSEEFGVHWNNRDDITSSLTFFNTDFKNRISSVYLCEDDGDATHEPGSAIIVGNCEVNGEKFKFIQETINVDKANLRGIEATASWQATDALRLTSNYTYSESKQKTGSNKGKPLNDTARHVINGTVDYAVTEPFSLWGHANMRGRSKATGRGGVLKKTPSFTLVDVGGNYQLSKNWKLGAAVYNLFDKQIDDKHYYRVYDGRRYWLSISAEF